MHRSSLFICGKQPVDELLSHMRVENFSPLCTTTKRALSLPNDPLTMLKEIIALWAIWTLLCPFLRLTVTWLKIFLDEMIDETFFVRLSVISRSKARFDQCKITKTSSRSSEAVSRKTSFSLSCYMLFHTHFYFHFFLQATPSNHLPRIVAGSCRLQSCDSYSSFYYRPAIGSPASPPATA